MTLRQWWNGLRWGAPGGPGELDGPHFTTNPVFVVTYYRNMSARRISRIERFRRMSEGGDSMGKHEGGSGGGKGGGGGKHEGTDKDKPSTGGGKGGTPATTPKNPGK